VLQKIAPQLSHCNIVLAVLEMVAWQTEQAAGLYPCHGKGKTPCCADQQKNLMRINHLLPASKISVACRMGSCRNGIAIHRVQGHSDPKAKELIPRPLEEKAAFSTPRATGGSS
jgi:hypothetical protein